MWGSAVAEDYVEQALLQWLARLAWAIYHGPDISRTGAKAPVTERSARHR
jgi:hypothetical protein